MRIIKDKNCKVFSCSRCSSELEVNLHFDIIEERSKYTNIHYYRKYFRCPCCGYKNILEHDS